MLTAQQRTEFDQRGFVRLSAAFSEVNATAMVDRVWAALGRKYGMCRSEPATWTETNVVGLQQLRTDPVFEAIGSPATVQAIDELLGAGRWKGPRHWGQLLISFPSAERSWTVPSSNWHTDFGFLTPPDRIFGVLVFSFLSEVPTHSGGTVVVAGSHRLIRRFVARQPWRVREKMKRLRKAFLRSEPWMKSLISNEDDPERVERFMGNEHVVSGVPLRVTELTGKPGDVVVGHPWLLHAPAPNCGSRPRIMCVQRVHLASNLPTDSLTHTTRLQEEAKSRTRGKRSMS